MQIPNNFQLEIVRTKKRKKQFEKQNKNETIIIVNVSVELNLIKVVVFFCMRVYAMFSFEQE